MIKVEDIGVNGFEFAIKGMRNPMNSHHLSDSYGDTIGEKDLDLMRRLFQGGQPHRKYARQICIWMSITAPLYWWKEFDTYKVGTTANSTSTMHKIHAKEFTLDDFSHEHLTARSEYALKNTILVLNDYRKMFIETNNKAFWWQMIQLLPSSYNQTRMVSMNYEVAMNMMEWRENHKLDEWREFVEILKSLPYMMEIVKKSK